MPILQTGKELKEARISLNFSLNRMSTRIGICAATLKKLESCDIIPLKYMRNIELLYRQVEQKEPEEGIISLYNSIMRTVPALYRLAREQESTQNEALSLYNELIKTVPTLYQLAKKAESLQSELSSLRALHNSPEENARRKVEMEQSVARLRAEDLERRRNVQYAAALEPSEEDKFKAMLETGFGAAHIND